MADFNDSYVKEEQEKSYLESLVLEPDNMVYLLNHYKPFILKTLRASDLLTFMPDLEMADKQRIIQLSRKGFLAESTDDLLDLLIKKKDEPGVWRAFIGALENAEYQIVLDVLKGRVDISHHNEHTKIIEIFATELHPKLLPRELLPSLLSKGLINQRDSQEIQSQESTEGAMSATLTLLDRIKCHVNDWYHLFLDVLFETDGYKYLAEKIDPEFIEKKQLQLKESQFDPKSRSCEVQKNSKSADMSIKENYVQVSGSAYKGNDVNAPNIPQSTIDDEFHDMVSDLSLSSFSSGGRSLLLSNNSPLDRVMNAHQQTSLPRQVVTGAEGNNDDEITRVKREISANNDNRDGSSTRISMNQLSSNGISSNPASLRSNPNIQDAESINLSSLGSGLDSKEMVKNVFQSIDREFNVTEQLEPNIRKEDSYLYADNQRPENEDQKEQLKLRSYQEELARPALNGKNSIIVAPTGSGKTHVAMKVIEEHLKQMKGKKVAKVVFLVEQSALADQQAKQCQKYLHAEVKLVTGDSQRTEKLQILSQWLDKRDILVATAQILLNALGCGDVKIQDFTLMVFDECHHTAYKHPYNQIMQRYMDLKFDKDRDSSSLPQVVGLTASVGVGRAKNLITAKEWVKKVMANLDSEELATVRSERQELSEHVNIPEEELKKVPGRIKDYFGAVLKKIMETIEKFMRTSEFAKFLPNAQNMLKAPAERGVDQYTQWISGLWRETAKIDDQNARRFFVTCRNYLDIYNKSLIVYADARVKDALDLIQDELAKWSGNTISDETDRKLQTLYEKSKKLLQHCQDDPAHDNPKLEALKEMIVKAYTDKPDMRGIVFVKTRDLVKAIETWMKETQGLKELRPVKFVGAQASTDKGGMTKVDQDNTLEFFRDGQHKIIIATSVAEEGLDIRKCNLVIRYDHVTNEIAMVQSRGRGRAEDSKYVVLAEQGRGTAEKEELNIIRENLMNKAIIELQDDISKDPQKFKTGQEKLQSDAKIERDLEAKSRGRRKVMEGEFELRCFRCSKYICFSSDIRKIQSAHHAAICSDLIDRVKITKLAQAQYVDSEIQSGIGKLNCLNCAYDLGNVSQHKKVQFPVLKISSFLIVDNMDRKNVFKRWKSVPFHVQELSHDDLRRMADGPQLVDYF